MNNVLETQKVRKRYHPVRLLPAEPRPAQRPRRVLRMPDFTGRRWVVAAISAILLFTVLLLLGFAFYFDGARRAEATLTEAADAAFERDFRSYVGLPVDTPVTNSASESLPLDLVETFAFGLYTVRPGDSVSAIATAHSLSISTVIAVNSIMNVKSLRSGIVLRIPNMDGIPYTVRKGDSLGTIAARHGIPLEAILDANDLSSATIRPGQALFLPGAGMKTEDLKRALGELFIYPIRGRLTSGYGWRADPFTGVRRFHAAVDLAAPQGTPVKAANDGKATSIGFNQVYGNYVILTHSDGYQTMYAHLERTRIKQGSRVVRGAPIGDVGSTGLSTGAHLHFAVFKNGRAVNPLPLLD